MSSWIVYFPQLPFLNLIGHIKEKLKTNQCLNLVWLVSVPFLFLEALLTRHLSLCPWSIFQYVMIAWTFMSTSHDIVLLGVKESWKVLGQLFPSIILLRGVLAHNLFLELCLDHLLWANRSRIFWRTFWSLRDASSRWAWQDDFSGAHKSDGNTRTTYRVRDLK